MTLPGLILDIHANAKRKGFWSKRPNIPEKLALVHSEVSEALEELRLPKFDKAKFGEELADIVIRVFDIAAWFDLDLANIIVRKHNKNLLRPRKHGKRF